MDFSKYVVYPFQEDSAINMATGYAERSYRAHWHTYGEITMVGTGDNNLFRVNQTVYTLKEGDFVLAWPMEVHEVIDADRMTTLVVQFSNAFANSLFDFQRIMHFYHDKHIIKKDEHPELCAGLADIILEMKKIFFENGRDRETKCCILLMRFMMLLDDHRKEFVESGETSVGYSRETLKSIFMVSDYIKNNLTDDDLSQSTMAAKAGISKEYFSKMFKEITGTNYSHWLNMIRIEKAISLFSGDKRTLTEIAMLSGFQSIPTFNRVFKEFKGISPGEYRSMYTEKASAANDTVPV